MRNAISARIEHGRSHRTEVPLESHAEVVVDEARPDPVALLLAQDEGRVDDLVPIRHARMGVTPFTFYRGSAAVMASDLSRTPSTSLRVQLCGDAHLSNFGVFNGPDRRLVFDLNDFDETAPGPFEWDLQRLAASVTIAGRNNELSSKQVRTATRRAVTDYRRTLRKALRLSPMALHYLRIEPEALHADEPLRKRSRKALDKAAAKDHFRALRKLTVELDGQRRIASRPPLLRPLSELAHERSDVLHDLFVRYCATLPPHRAAVLDRYRYIDIAHKVVGVGSVGTLCFIVLLESDDGSPLFLQFKEATESVLEAYVGSAGFDRAGERVVRGQRLMQATGDVMLGWSHGEASDGRTIDFYFRQLWDGKGSAEVDEMGPKRLRRYAGACGAALALAHARTGDGAAIAGYVGVGPDGDDVDGADVDEVVVEFAERYADLAEADHAAHEEAVADGRIEVADG